jgi:glycosyltransferase involved in cell wall biosynthesis
VVLFAGHLYVQKGVYDLLFAFKKVVECLKRNNIKLLFAGKGPEASGILSFIKQMRLREKVRLIGSHPYSEMPTIHNLADVFVLPSQPSEEWQEQFGYVLVESMACGKPVVSTTSGSIPEVVGNAGILVPPNDFVSLAGALEELVKSGERRYELGGQGRSRVEQLFDSKVVAERIRDHYTRLLHG